MMADIDLQNSVLVISQLYIGDILPFCGKVTHFTLYMQIASFQKFTGLIAELLKISLVY